MKYWFHDGMCTLYQKARLTQNLLTFYRKVERITFENIFSSKVFEKKKKRVCRQTVKAIYFLLFFLPLFHSCFILLLLIFYSFCLSLCQNVIFYLYILFLKRSLIGFKNEGKIYILYYIYGDK